MYSVQIYIFLICWNVVVVVNSVANVSRSLVEISSASLHRDVFPFMDFTTAQQISQWHPYLYRMIDCHLEEVAINYWEVMDILNLTIGEFCSRFPSFQTPDVGQEPVLPTGSVRHQMYNKSDNIIFNVERFSGSKAVVFQMRDMTHVRHRKMYLVFQLENGFLLSCQLCTYLRGSHELFSFWEMHDHMQMVHLMTSAFHEKEVFSIRHYQLTNIKNKNWRGFALKRHLKLHQNLLMSLDGFFICCGSIVVASFGASGPEIRLLLVMIALVAGFIVCQLYLTLRDDLA